MSANKGSRAGGSALLRLLLAIAVVCSVVLAVVAGMSWRASRANSVQMLAEGTEIQFLGVRVGNSSFSTETAWQGWAREYLPAPMTRGLPSGVVAACGSSTNSITAYFRIRPTVAGGLPWQGYAAQGDDQFVYERQGGYCSFGGPNTVYGLILQAFPRRQKDFWLLLQDAKNQPLAKFRIPNPFQGPFPEWTPLPLPQVVKNGPVRLTLRSVSPGGEKPFQFLNAEWHLESEDPLWTHAKPGFPRLGDATGNEANWLNPAEPVWRVRSVVHRRGFAPFQPDERLVLTNVVFPQAAEANQLNYSNIVSGLNVTVQLLAPAGRLVISNDVVLPMTPLTTASSGGRSVTSGAFGRVETWGRNTPFALVKVVGASEFDEVRCRLVDESGRESEGTSDYEGSSGARLYTAGFDLTRVPERVTLEVVVSRPLIFEFFVSPDDVTRR